MNIKENTIVFKIDNENNFADFNAKKNVTNFIADLSGISLDVAESIKNKFITFDKTISEINGSFVIVCDFSFDENLNIVPTLQEAYDYIEMEEIERQLNLKF
ncbi:MAG: hypothetical protein CMD15_06455 [Flavobacteriales bacterium]|nr:hypothetical protein [Flavobacteriales bacterium]